MKFERFNNNIEKEEAIEEMVIEGVEEELKELENIKERRLKMGFLKNKLKRGIIGISVVLASMFATEALAGDSSDFDCVRRNADDMFKELKIEEEKMEQRKPFGELLREQKSQQVGEDEKFQTPKRPYKIEDLFEEFKQIEEKKSFSVEEFQENAKQQSENLGKNMKKQQEDFQKNMEKQREDFPVDKSIKDFKIDVRKENGKIRIYTEGRMRGYTGNELLTEDAGKKLFQQGASFLTRTRIKNVSRNLSLQLAGYEELKNKGEDEKAEILLKHIHKSVKMYDKAFGEGIIDHSKIPELE
ncbi:hypothetical protein JW698_00990 [Candidatus Wolfebacteria bacterium]|nr:hypothetical protein [Candidatus Wolfebacteria bacterium]